jgi:hypothetical protein
MGNRQSAIKLPIVKDTEFCKYVKRSASWQMKREMQNTELKKKSVVRFKIVPRICQLLIVNCVLSFACEAVAQLLIANCLLRIVYCLLSICLLVACSVQHIAVFASMPFCLSASMPLLAACGV